MIKWAENLRDTLQIVSYGVGIAGVIYGLVKYRNEKQKERLAREKEAFAISNQRYVEYLRLCLQYPDLDGFDIPREDPEVQRSGLDHRKIILLSALTSMLETAYLFYRGKPTKQLRAQWDAWDRYVRLWARREEYRRAWPLLRKQFHDEFIAYMDSLVHEPRKGE